MLIVLICDFNKNPIESYFVVEIHCNYKGKERVCCRMQEFVVQVKWTSVNCTKSQSLYKDGDEGFVKVIYDEPFPKK